MQFIVPSAAVAVAVSFGCSLTSQHMQHSVHLASLRKQRHTVIQSGVKIPKLMCIRLNLCMHNYLVHSTYIVLDGNELLMLYLFIGGLYPYFQWK